MFQWHHRHGPRYSSSRNRRDHHDDSHHQYEDWDDNRSHPSRSTVEEENWYKDQDAAQTFHKEAHKTYEEDQDHSNCSDDHIISHNPYSGPPEPQPGSYPHGEQLTSKNTSYEDLQDSLVTQDEEDLLMQGRVEKALQLEGTVADKGCHLPPPPLPKEGDHGYEDYVRRRASEE